MSPTDLAVDILPTHLTKLPIAFTPLPIPVVILPNTDMNGPNPKVASCTAVGNLLNHNIIFPSEFTNGFEAVKACANLGNN